MCNNPSLRKYCPAFLMEMDLKTYLPLTSRRTAAFAATFAATLLTACGGGSTTTPTPTPSITSVTADKLMYGKVSRFTVAGTGLDNNSLKMTGAGCANITPVVGGSASSQVISCTPSVAGSMPLTLTVTGMSAPFVSTQTVPAPQVTMKTSMGDMVIELYPSNAPLTVNNFLQYANDSFYNNLTFHRVISTFMIQGGGYNSAMAEVAARAPIKLESVNGLSNVRGAIAMARRSEPNSATSQFFINVVDNVRLDGTNAGVDGYAVFGKVVTGMAVADLIKAVPTKTVGDFADVPVTPIVITSASQTQ
jgi:peptidyl-prolyl cis-trans isomerase A (cyclophilin A)